MAHLSRSGTRTGEIVADMIRFPLERGGEGDGGKFLVHDALAVGVLLWPELFIQARMAVDVVTSGKQSGRSKPAVAKDKARQIGAVISTSVDDFLERLIERTCNERFVV
jgi:inosine-uridine nucleoside N-ribohydrolase